MRVLLRHRCVSAMDADNGGSNELMMAVCRPNLIKGFMQLYSVEQNRSQALEAHSACFTSLTLGGKTTNAIVFTTKTFANGVMNSKIHCIALGGSHKKNAELFFPSEFADDFPVSLQIRCVPCAA